MVLPLGCGSARAGTYRFISFDYPGAAGATMASGINDAGQVVGAYADGAGEHGFLEDGPVFSPIDYPGATITVASKIDDAGQILVESHFDRTGDHGLLMDVPSEGPRSGQGIGECD
jgi:uncharacterized membrane protein